MPFAGLANLGRRPPAFPGLEPGGYAAILADPPWHWAARSAAGEGRSARRHYQTMDLDRLAALPVASLARPHCALFLWVVDPMLPAGLALLEAWGFAFKTVAFTWVKRTSSGRAAYGTGYWTRANPEQVLLGVRGQPRRRSAGVPQLLEAPVREHSRKPDAVAERVEQLVDGPYCELFARARRPGWASWGDQVGRFGS
jgi:N6-adenosine-specific RNA methylase IME4